MFYCEPCREKSDWPTTIMRSKGPCECCGEMAVCYDRPSRLLPLPKGVGEQNMTDNNLEQDDFEQLRAEVDADPVAKIAYLLHQVMNLVDQNVAQISDEDVNRELQRLWQKVDDSFERLDGSN
jgi:hypothetical protein